MKEADTSNLKKEGLRRKVFVKLREGEKSKIDMGDLGTKKNVLKGVLLEMHHRSDLIWHIRGVFDIRRLGVIYF